ncbi:DUF4251 domain-containing protein [Allomuricauda sp. F6463D]|uniref:DUF4251 domain-containing protein n=1 Tax=Allomuricauda sp. F6463D TaxID=2926409 RepID=UPI001FF2EA7F|nr:DUF4251 domain-containing protein [Muricauda sp. F6463D]MCK0159598.1 DUF4251 domain-containing protein [Muricauda sp. F6463D]
MNSIVKITACILLCLTIGCVSSKSKATPEEITVLENMIANKHFEVRAKWAQPMASQSLNSIANAGLLPPGSTASQIDVSGTGGYFRMKGDSVMADLPFYGERRMGGYYNQNKTGIIFNGIPKELTFSSNNNGAEQTMRFSIKEKSEGYQVQAQLYANGTARLTISSTHRTTMWYQGNLSKHKKE